MSFQSLGEVKDASAPGGAVICFSFLAMVLLILLPGETRPTWAYPADYGPALAFSVLSRLLLLTRLAVRSARREPGERAAFPCSITIPVDDLGPLSAPTVLCSRWSNLTVSNLTACHLAQASQSLWLVDFYDAYERSFGFNRVIRF